MKAKASHLPKPKPNNTRTYRGGDGGKPGKEKKTSTYNVETSDNIQNKRGHLYHSVACIDFKAS